MRRWQLAHNLRGDGKIGPATVKAAQAGTPKQENKEEPDAEATPASGDEPKAVSHTAGQQERKKGKHHGKVEHVTFGEDEGSTVEGDNDTSVGGEVLENPALVDDILDGAAGMEKAEKPDAKGEALERGGETVGQVNEAREAANKIEGVEGAEAPWIKAAMAPAITHLLLQHKFADAAILLAKQFSPSEYFEGISYAVEKLGIDVAKPLLKWLCGVGLEANVVFELVGWTYEGIKAVQEAHERGDQASRLRMYARAFADGFLYGEGAEGGRAGAVTAEQKEAVELGLRDGSATAGGFGAAAPSIGKELLRRFHGEAAARHALMDALMKRAGVGGVWT